MSQIKWDQTGEKKYELGVDHGVLYRHGDSGETLQEYALAYPWNGLTAVNEAPDGGDANDQYADNIKYVTIMGTENYVATIEALNYPPEFAECDGSAEIAPGVYAGQQRRKPFGFTYRTKIGNDVDGEDAGYKLHLVYGMLASPSDKDYETMNESPEAMTFSWECRGTAVPCTGYRPTAHLVIDSTKTDATKLAALEAILYGQDASEAKDAVYKETTDDAPQTGKTYYTKSGNIYTEFSGSTFDSGTTYYEMVSPAVPAKEATNARLPKPDEVMTIMRATTGG